MFRTSDIVLFAVMVSAAAYTYKTKHDAESVLSEVARLQDQIRFEEDTISILKADWSLLTQPSRLQKLADIYRDELHLEVVGARQIVGIDDVPARPITIEDLSNERLGGMAEHTVDPKTRTGGIVQ